MEEKKSGLIPANYLHCLKDKHSIFLCTSENCKQTAFICNDESCECIQDKHYGCSSHATKYIVDSIEKQRKDMSEQNQDAFDTVIKIYEDMIERISKEKEQFIDFIEMFGLGVNMRKFVNLVKEGRWKEIDGDFCHKLHAEIQRHGQQLGNLQLNQKKIKSVWEQKCKELDGILAKLSQLRYQYEEKASSKIIGDDGFTNIKNFIPKTVKRFELLYRASQNEFSAQKFHQKCDGVEDTIVIAQTQYGKILGGYTSVKWQSPQSGHHKQDHSGKSFIFSLTLNEKYELIQKQKAIRVDKDYGPIFGGGRDLLFSNQCHINNNSGANFPTSYSNGKYQRNQTAYTALTGQTNGFKFRVKQYEVFKVVWK